MRIQHFSHQLKTIPLLLIGLVVAVSGVVGIIMRPIDSASALSGSEFNAGRIIDDGVFFNGSSMSVAQIQSFLNSKVPTCDTNGTQAYAGTTRAAYGASKGYPAPYTCLKDYKQTTTSIAPESGICSGYTGASNESSATIIYKVAQSCGINPQVLLVMLEKEQSLVTDDWPWSIQYQKALGAFCPDTSPCDSGYAGFFKQMYYGANRLKVYTANPTSFNYRAGRNNTIYYNPGPCKTYNSSGQCTVYYGRFGDAPDIEYCGSSTVYIQNQATANLYIYTPYQPNQTALNNLYGTGDSCSSYGNRNFWRMFNDWFGSTEGSYLLRTASDATVYLVSEDRKYPIGDLATLNALYPMGSVRYVSDSYLASLTTGQKMKRLIKGSGSALYFFDAGIKLAFSSCSMVTHYGMSCSDYAELTDIQINQFATGPSMPRTMNTTSGKWFYMENGTKREATNQAALSSNGLTTTNVRLHESSLANLSLGLPITQDNTVITTRGKATKSFVSGSTRYAIPSGLSSLSFLSAMNSGQLDQESLNKLSSVSFNGFLTNGTAYYVLNNGGKASATNHADLASSYTTIPQSLLNAIPNSQAVPQAPFIKSDSSSTVYRVESGEKAPVQSWQDLVLINSNPTITTLPKHYLDNLTTIRNQYGPTRLVKSSNSSTVYMIDGLHRKRAVTSFSIVNAAGIKSNVVTVTQQTLGAYATSSGSASHLIKCGTKYYLATGGSIREMAQSLRQEYGFTDTSFVAYETETCAALSKGSGYTARYVRSTNSKSIYYVQDGQKRPFSSYAAYVSHGGTANNTALIESSVVSSIPTGATL